MSPTIFAQPRRTTVANRVVLALITLIWLTFSPGVGALVVAPALAMDPRAMWVAIPLGSGAFLAAWWVYLRWARVAAAGQIAIEPGQIVFGSGWPLRVNAAKIQTIRVTDALGLVGFTAQKRAEDTLHIAWSIYRCRLTLDPETARRCLSALIDACPRALVIEQDGAARRPEGGWTEEKLAIANRFYWTQARLLLWLALPCLLLGGTGLLSALYNPAGSLAAIPLLGFGFKLLGSVRRLRRLAGALPVQ